MLMANPNWIPNHQRNPHLTQETKNVIVEIIMEVIESRSLPISNTTVKKLSCSYVEHLIESLTHQQVIRAGIPLKFNASANWLRHFKSRYKFSRRKFHFKRRLDIDQSKVNHFLKMMKIIFENFQQEMILNVDETFWWLL